MSTYRTHTFFNLSFFLPLSFVTIFYFFAPNRFDLIVYSLSFAYATLFMTPDADLANKVKLFSLRGLMTLPFRPYSFLFSHRGISHWFIVGTITRILWLSLLFIAIYTLVYQRSLSLEPILEFYQVHKLSLLYCFAGLSISDLGHLILDKK